MILLLEDVGEEKWEENQLQSQTKWILQIYRNKHMQLNMKQSNRFLLKFLEELPIIT
jgi:hypothetical protein